MHVLHLVLWLVLGAAQQNATGSVEGTVLRAGTTEPVAGAQVTLVPPVGTAKNQLTDKDGHFSFATIAPGRYQIRLQRDGYLSPSTTSEGISVGDGQRVTGLKYFLSQGGTISGRILDAGGRPSVGASITAFRLDYQEGRPTLTAMKTASTNDRGEYRMFWVEAGDYVIRAEKALPAGPASGYYPGTDDPSRAVRVHVGPGTEAPKIDISIRNTPLVKVSGTLTTIVASLRPPTPPAGVPPDQVGRLLETALSASQSPQFFLFSAERDEVLETIQSVPNALTSAEDRAAGKFELRNVRPGTYELIATLIDRNSTPARYFVARTTVDVGFQDLTGVSLTILPGLDLHGRVVNNSTTPLGSDPVTVRLRPRDFPVTSATPFLTAIVDADGTFTIPNVPNFEYAVSVGPLPRNTYVEDLRQGSFSIFDVGTILVGGRSNRDFEIVLDSPGATINGRVSGSPEQVTAGVAVALVPDERRRENAMLYKRMNATAAGTFSFTGVAPGRYTLFAWESIPAGAEFNLEFMDAFRDEGISLTVAPGDTSAISVRLIPK